MGRLSHVQLASQAGYQSAEFKAALASLVLEFKGVEEGGGDGHYRALAALAMHGPSVPYLAAALREFDGVNPDLLQDVPDTYYSPGV